MEGNWNLAALFERVVDVVPDRPAVVTPARRLSYRQLDERANRLAHHLAATGIEPGDHVALLMQNGTEYLEAMLACFKLRAVPVNINYRYVERELEHLFGDSGAVAVVCDRAYWPRVEAVAPACPELTRVLVVAARHDGDTSVPPGTDDYETALAGADPSRPVVPDRSGDDRYIAYTGGTTGLPKGVVWRHEDIFFAALGGGDPTRLEGPVSAPEELGDRVPEIAGVQLICPPLMHVSAHWGAMQCLYGGSTVVLLGPGPFDPREALATVAAEGVMILVLVGDAMARPLVDTLDGYPADDTPDLSSLFVIGSGGAILSAPVKDALRAHLPTLIIVDGYGSSETGVAGSQTTAGDATPPSFVMDADTTVLDDGHRPVAAGSGIVGRLARRGHVPLGYHPLDPDVVDDTFVEIDGVRWVVPGDLATPEADGTITLLGRGSMCINTGGEKVFPEEVEACLKAHPSVYDAVVVGVDDPTWGQRVAAVVSLREGTELDLDAVQQHCRTDLAGYKVPRTLVAVDEVVRQPTGKADYRWAAATAATATE